jgi:hypothetical protein
MSEQGPVIMMSWLPLIIGMGNYHDFDHLYMLVFSEEKSAVVAGVTGKNSGLKLIDGLLALPCYKTMDQPTLGAV